MAFLLTTVMTVMSRGQNSLFFIQKDLQLHVRMEQNLRTLSVLASSILPAYQETFKHSIDYHAIQMQERLLSSHPLGNAFWLRTDPG